MGNLRIHREGRNIVLLSIVLLGALVYILNTFVFHNAYLDYAVLAVSLILFIAVAYFFRDPIREIQINDNHIIAPADGKIVVIEEVEEPEYFKDKRKQVSIFMSPANVHLNRTPIAGDVKYTKYHPGKYLVAWHPKSSTDNERNTIVIENNNLEILVRQIAGVLARRIVSYLNEGDKVDQGNELGFIKFGSRVDLFLPLNTEINVELKEKVKGGKTIIGKIIP